MFIIKNENQAVKETSYWRSEHAAASYFFMSWNAGAARVLVPGPQSAMLKEVKGAAYVILSRGKLQGRDAREILFEDGSDAPDAIHLLSEKTDRTVPAGCPEAGFIVTLWTREGLQQSFPGRYRESSGLPDMSPWPGD